MRLLLASIFLLGALPDASAGPDHRMTVTVRVYDAWGMTPRELKQARATATAIFRDAEVEVRWRDCSRSSNTHVEDPCGDRVGSGAGVETVLRLLAAPIGFRWVGDNVLGYSRLQPGVHVSVITIFVNRVRDTAETASADSGTLLGRVLAHELGHVLLGPGQHSATGLMRPEWALDEIRRGKTAELWMFTPRDILGMQRALVARAAP
jgi:hypothetical protein